MTHNHHVVGSSPTQPTKKDIMKDRIKPIPTPRIPHYTESDLRVLMDEWEEEVEAVRAENDVRFKRALKVIRRCAFLRGFMSLFGNSSGISQTHFKWCPSPEWESHMRRRPIFEIAEPTSKE